MRWLCLLGILALVTWFAIAGRKQIRAGGPDFEYFYKAGAWLVRYGSFDPGYDIVDGQVEPRGTLEWYWPFVARFMTPFALLPFRTAGYVWLGLNVAAVLATLRLIGRHLTGRPQGDWPVIQLVPFALVGSYWLWEFRLNQINNLTLLLMVGSLVCWQVGRRGIAGFWLGLAVLLKLTPGLLVLWFALKRQYRTVAVAVLTIVLAGPAADVVALRPALAADVYRAWFRKAVTTGSPAGLIGAQREMDWRNQALGAVLSRWLHPTDYNTRFDNDPRVQASYGARAQEPKTLNVVCLSLANVAHIVTGASILTVAGLVWLARRPARQLSPGELRLEWALFVLAMLWLMPVMRRYHLIWTLPALSLLCAWIAQMGIRQRWSWLATCGLIAVGTAQFALLSRRWEAAGVLLASAVALAVPLLFMIWRLRRASVTPPVALSAETMGAKHGD